MCNSQCDAWEANEQDLDEAGVDTPADVAAFMEFTAEQERIDAARQLDDPNYLAWVSAQEFDHAAAYGIAA